MSKSTKTKGSIKGKPAAADGFTSLSQNTSAVTSGTATPAPKEQSYQVAEAVQAAVVREPIDVLHPEQPIHELVTAKTAVSASEEVTLPPAATATPKAARRGTLGSLFSYITGGSQGSQSSTNDGQAGSKIEDTAEQAKDSADDSAALPSAPKVVSDGTQAQADSLDAVGLGISNDATDGPPKSKKKKPKSKSKKEAQVDVTACDSERTEITMTIPLSEFVGNDAVPENSTADTSASSGSPSSRTARAYLQSQKETGVIQPKPLRKTHKRAASSKHSSDDSTDQSSAVVKSNRRSSKEVSAAAATQAAQRSHSPTFAILLISNSPRADTKQIAEHFSGKDRIEDVTEDVSETEMVDSKVFDINSNADANDRVSPEVEEMRARLNELHQKEQQVKQSKGKEKAEAQ